MGIVKTDAGRWKAVLKDGRIYVKSRTFDLKRDAETWLGQERATLKAGVRWDEARRPLRAWLPRFLEHRKSAVATTTYKTDVTMMDGLPAWFRGRALNAIAPSDVERVYREFYDEGRARAWSSVNRLRSSLGSLFTWLVKQRLIVVSPVLGAKLPANVDEPRDIRPWTRDGLLKQVADWSTFHASSARLALFLGLTGLRWSEARALRVEDVQRDVDHVALLVQRAQPEGVEVKSTKNKRSRRVPVAALLVPHVDAWARGKQSTDPLLPPMHRSRFVQQLRWSETAGGRTIHDLRHTAITLWLSSGIDVVTVQAWAGHATLAMTSRYTHWLGTSADAVGLSKLDAALGGT